MRLFFNRNMDSPAAIEHETAALCKGADKKDDALMIMAPSYNWEQFLMPAPMAIAILGDLILISAGNDFSIAEKAPIDGFKYIRYPDSFRASLVQLSNAGWNAFNEAHTCMDQIRLHTGGVDTHVRYAVNHLLKGTTKEIEKIVPLSLRKIQDIADKSRDLAEGIEIKFVNVMQLTGELLEACTAAKGQYDEKNKAAERAIAVAKEEETIRLTQKEENSKRLKKMEKEIGQAQTDLKESLNSMPSTVELVGLAVVDTVIDTVRSVTGKYTKQCASPDKVENGEASADLDSKMTNYNIYKTVGQFSNLIDTLLIISTEGGVANAGRKPNFSRIKDGDVRYIVDSIAKIKAKVEAESNCRLQDEVLGMCREAIQICDRLNAMVSGNAVANKQDTMSIIQEIEELQKICKTQNTKASIHLKKNPLDCKPPYLSKSQSQRPNSSLMQTAVEGSRYKTENAKATLTDLRNREEKALDEMTANNEELIKTLKELAGLKLDQINFEDIANTLVKGITALAQVRAQWGKLVRFFQMLSNLIKCCLHTSLTDFIDQAKIGRELKLEQGTTMPLSDIFKDVIFEQASKASQISYVINTVSATYVEISENYLMDRVTSLGLLLALDPADDSRKIQLSRDALYTGCEDAQRAIKDTVGRHKQNFAERIDDRLAKIRALEEKLPYIEPEKIAEIQQTVKDGFDQAEIDGLI